MARVNITLPDVVLARAREADLNISRLAAQAVQNELDGRIKLAGLRGLLDEMDTELGPGTAEERQRAVAWAERELGPQVQHARSA